ncbi:MAG TPA: hypothetical protein VJY12_03040, partial [Dysgonamonadaceae bacterium]|nr:hypothetical protein [Dysgonamonadaceae bacterium]
ILSEHSETPIQTELHFPSTKKPRSKPNSTFRATRKRFSRVKCTFRALRSLNPNRIALSEQQESGFRE